VRKKSDPATTPIVHKRRFGPVYAWTTDIDKFFGRNRHDNVLQACDKVKAADKNLFDQNFFEGEYIATNGQKYRRYGVTRIGFVAMMKYVKNLADKAVLYLAAYDREEEEANRRKGPPDLDPAIIPDDPAALEPVKPTIALDVSEEAGGPVGFALRYLAARGETPTAERVAEVLHHLPPALEEYLPPLDEPVVHADGMRVYCTTMEIAAFFRKRHKDVLAALREIELLQPEFGRPNFRPITYTDSHGREQPAFEVTKAGFAVLVGRFTGPEALAFQIRYVQRFEEMEAALKAQTDGVRRYGSIEDLRADPDALLSLTISYAGQVKTLTTRLADAEPKAAALDRFADRKGIVNLTQAAKALGIGRNFFCRELRRLHYLYYTGKYDDLVAYEKYVKAGFFEHRPVVITDRQGNQRGTVQPFVTAAGIAEFGKVFGTGVQAVLGQGVLGLGTEDSLH
jgi:Rha family phage regulatory protein